MRLILVTLFTLLIAVALGLTAGAAGATPASDYPILASPQESQDAWALFRNRDYARALERFEKKEANLYPDWEVVHDAMGWCHFFLQDYPAAEAKFNKALQINPNYKWSLQGLQALEDLHAAPLQAAQDSLSAGRYSEARAAFQRIQEGLTIAPKEDIVAAMIGEAWCLYSLGRAKDAKTIFRNALRKKRGDAECYFGIGYCDYALADYRNALASLELGLKAEPGNYLAQITIGWSYYWRQKYDKAIEAFDDAS
ncbi:MAG: tetratricopeptide repeat protein, partial [Planctomycetes bacterium]|nr:tetratricopeptide repeat protein [Planctomycetota bacterium]